MRTISSGLIVVFFWSLPPFCNADPPWLEHAEFYLTIAGSTEESITAEGEAALKPLGFHRDSSAVRHLNVPTRGIFVGYKSSDLAGAIIHQTSQPGCIAFSAINFNVRAVGLANSAADAVKAHFRKAFGDSLALFSDAKCSHAL